MIKRSSYEDGYDYEDDDYEEHRGPRKFKKDEPPPEKRKKWDRESQYDRDHDYDDRR